MSRPCCLHGQGIHLSKGIIKKQKQKKTKASREENNHKIINK
jgi:hypothetical protein